MALWLDPRFRGDDKNIMAIVKGTFFILWILACSAVGAVVKPFNRRYVLERMLPFCYRNALKILGVRLTVVGAPASARPLLLVTNHSSYLDILIVAAAVPVCFTPKSEVGEWPLIGALSRLIDCVFIDRRIHRTAENQARIKAALEDGRVVCLFPEGTTSDGKRVLPFRSSYFKLGEEEFAGGRLTVQPAAIAYTHVCNLPLDTTQRPRIAWYGDMPLAGHFKELLALGPIHATLEFLEPTVLGQGKDRKTLAAECQESVTRCFSRQIS